MERTFLLIFVFFIPFCHNENPQKQIRADACLKLMDYRLGLDKTYYDSLFKKFQENSNDINKLLTIAVLACYNSLSYYDAEEIMRTQKLDPFTEENKNRLNLDKWIELFQSGDQDKINYEMGMINEANRDVETGEISLKPRRDDENEQEGQRDERFNYIPTGEKKELDFNIFGIKFSQLSEKSKKFIGLGLLLLVLLVILFGLRKILSFNKDDKPKKKKNKKNK